MVLRRTEGITSKSASQVQDATYANQVLQNLKPLLMYCIYIGILTSCQGFIRMLFTPSYSSSTEIELIYMARRLQHQRFSSTK